MDKGTIDPILVELEEWKILRESPGFKHIIAYIDRRRDLLRLRLTRLAANPSLDTAFQATDIQSRIAELEEFKREVEWKMTSYVREVTNAKKGNSEESI